MTNIARLHRVETELMGQQIICIKENSPDEKVCIALAHIKQPLDCCAYDIMYHLHCYMDQQRKTEAHSRVNDSESNVRLFLADIEILNAVRCSLALGKIVTTHDVNEEYIDILNDAGVPSRACSYRKHLKELITEHIENVKFVKSHRSNESQHIITTQTLGATVSDTRESQLSNEESVHCLEKAAKILRRDILNMEKWTFTGSMTDFEPQRKLVAFMK